MSNLGTDDDDSESGAEAKATKICFLEIDWLTNTDDYEPPASPSAVPASLLPQNMLSAPVTSDRPTPSPHSHMSPSDCPSALSHESNYFTRSQASQKANMHSQPSLLAVSISIALDPSGAPIPESYDEIKTELCRLQMENGLMKKVIAKANSETKASNAHCTIMTHAASASKTELENQKRKTHRSVKTNAHLISHPMLIEKHKADLELKALRASEAAKVEAQKATKEALREVRIQEEIRTRIFTGESNPFFTIRHLMQIPEPLSSFKWKDNLIALSGTLGLKMSGTINELTSWLKTHLTAHPEIKHNPRFSGIFLTHRCHVEDVILLDETDE